MYFLLPNKSEFMIWWLKLFWVLSETSILLNQVKLHMNKIFYWWINFVNKYPDSEPDDLVAVFFVILILFLIFIPVPIYIFSYSY